MSVLQKSWYSTSTSIWSRLTRLNHCNALECIRKWKENGIIKQMTDNPLVDPIITPSKFYLGIDATAPSLHLGHLLGIAMAVRLFRIGYDPIFVIGTATATVGDPSFRSKAKDLLEDTVIAGNAIQIKNQLQSLLNHVPEMTNRSMILDNSSWLQSINLLSFLKQVGRVSPLARMLHRENMQSRLASASASTEGVSFAELSYQLLQAFDFWHLYQHYNCRIQIGGSDQWGNMISGIELISKLGSIALTAASDSTRNTILESNPNPNNKIDAGRSMANAITFPLLVDPSGKEKMSKSAGNAIWLDAKLTHPLEFYQYFYQLPETSANVIRRHFFLAEDQVQNNDESMAYDMTCLVHGEAIAQQVQMASKILHKEFYNEETIARHGDLLRSTFSMSPCMHIDLGSSDPHFRLLDLICSHFHYSKTRMSRLVATGAVCYNGSVLTEEAASTLLGQTVQQISDQNIFIRVGKSHHLLFRKSNC